MTGNVLAIVLGYLIGAIPMGVILGKLLKGIDIRDYGSGKIGTANVTRSLGVKAGVFVLLFDMGKGVAATYVGRNLGDSTVVEVLAAMAAVAGHNWSVFIRFHGGRGVSTGLGALFAMVPPWAAGALGTGLLVIGATRYVSLGSMAGALFAAVALLPLAITGHAPWQYFAYASVVTSLIVFQHRDNIARLRRGEERRLGHKAERRQPGQTTAQG